MSREAPREVWISWCDHCGHADYAYNRKPEKADAGCPKCETGPDYQLIAGPYVLAPGART